MAEQAQPQEVLGPQEQTATVRTPQPTPVRQGLVLTAAAWLICRLVITLAWGPARTVGSLKPDQWIRWDSFNYLWIVQSGNTFGRCGSPGFPMSALERYAHVKWCGNAGWLPGYPLVVKLVATVGIAPDTAGMLVAWLATAAAIFLIWFGWCRDLSWRRALVVLVLFGVFPGAVYNFAIFPTSLALVAVIGAIIVAARRHLFTSAVLMTVAGLCYPSAWFAAVGFAIGLVLIAVPEGRDRIVRNAAWGLAGLSSLVVLAVYDAVSVNVWDAYFVFQQSNVGGFPVTYLLDLLVTATTVQQHLIGRFGARVLSLQVAVILAITGTAAGVAGKAYREHRQDPATTIAACVGVGVVVGMLVSQNVSAWNRSVVLAAPCIVGLRKLPATVLVPITVVTAVATVLLSRYFFQGSMI